LQWYLDIHQVDELIHVDRRIIVMLHPIHRWTQWNDSYWRAGLFLGLCSLRAMNADSCTDRLGKQLRLISYTKATMKVWASCHRLSPGMKPPSTAAWIGAIQHPHGRRNLSTSHQLKNLWFDIRKALFLWTSCLRWQLWTPTPILKQEIRMFAFVDFVPHGKYTQRCSSTTMPGHDRSIRTTQAIIKPGSTGLPATTHHPLDFHSLDPLHPPPPRNKTSRTPLR
jgi:hypothetical protein